MLTEAGDLAAAERICAAGLARSRDAGDLQNLAALLNQITILDLRAGRTEDAAAHLREALQIDLRTGGRIERAQRPGLLRVPVRRTGRYAEAVTVWAAFAALCGRRDTRAATEDARVRQEPLREARQALGPPGPARPRNAARR